MRAIIATAKRRFIACTVDEAKFDDLVYRQCQIVFEARLHIAERWRTEVEAMCGYINDLPKSIIILPKLNRNRIFKFNSLDSWLNFEQCRPDSIAIFSWQIISRSFPSGGEARFRISAFISQSSATQRNYLSSGLDISSYNDSGDPFLFLWDPYCASPNTKICGLTFAEISSDKKMFDYVSK